MSGNCTFITNQKNGKSALCDGYQYNFAKSNKENKHWRCVMYHINKCAGKMTTVENNVVKFTEHSHAPDARNSEKRVALSELRMKAVNSRSPSRRIIRAATSKISTSSEVQLPNYNSMSRNIRRIRNKANTTPVIPTTLSALILADPFTKTVKGDNFVLYDNSDDVNRIVMFGTKNNLTFLVHCDDWYMDGTFNITPPMFKQVYTIHGRRGKRHFPLVYALACKKDYFTYEAIFSQLKLLEPRLKPERIMMDFEKAAIKAAEDVFENVKVSACFFHFCQCLYRQIQANGLQSRYNSDPNFATHFRCLAALAFVPPSDVVKQFTELKKFEFFKNALNGTSDIDLGVRNILLYMEANWIGTMSRRAHRPGLFPIDLWNVYSVTLEMFPRTNNAIEAWHNAIAIMFGIAHPNIFKFIDGMKLEQDATEVLIDKLFAGIQIDDCGNKKYAKLSERILNVVKTYNVENNKFHIESYLYGLAQSIHFAT